MAVTHADLSPSRKSTDLSSKTGAFLMVVSILLGLLCFILCLVAEASRSEVKWADPNNDPKGPKSQCAYTSSGKIALLSASGAFLALALAMIVQHTYLLVAITKSDSLMEISWDPDSNFANSLAWQAGFLIVATWLSFAVGEILLLIGLSVESGHLKYWEAPRANCLVVRPGLFTASGALGLVTVFLASGLYVTALRAETHFLEREITRRGIIEAAVLYASPPGSPDAVVMRSTAPSRSDSSTRQDRDFRTLQHYLAEFDHKHTSSV